MTSWVTSASRTTSEFAQGRGRIPPDRLAESCLTQLPQDEDVGFNVEDVPAWPALRASEESRWLKERKAIQAKGLSVSPTQPTRKEIQEYVLTHLPPRSWCGHCLRVKGTSFPHLRSKTEGEHVVPTVSVDNFFMGPSGQEEAQGVLPMLEVKSHESRVTFAHVVERKGPVDSTTRRLVADLDWLGLRKLMFKSDQEPAILAVMQAVRESMPTVEFVMEESLVEEHQSNGTIEVTVREIQKQVRVMKSALEERMKSEVHSRHPILAFLVEHAGRLMSRYQVGRDGRTAYELHAVKPYRRQLVEFGERVYFVPVRPGGARQAKLDPKWQDGGFISLRDRSDEMLIMTPSGVYNSRNVRRRPELERWDFEFLTTLKGTPWNPNPAAGEMAADALPADMAVPMPAPAPVLSSWLRRTVQRAGCTSGGPLCRHMATA